jgi:Zn finger protein HypA/HybF involved in hydrogenase expression
VNRYHRIALHALPAGIALLCVGCWGGGDFPPLERHTIGASNHGPYFPIGATDVHHGLDCQACHGGTASFLEFTCITCHDHAQEVTDPQHLGIQDYAYGPSTCYGCHRNGSITGVDHASFFPISANAKHAGMRCVACHPQPTDRKVFTCTECHDHSRENTDPGHAAVAGYEYADSACYRCHPTGEAMTRTLHASFFPILAGAHNATACADCHTDPNSFRTYECIDCHDHRQEVSDPAHANVPGYSFVSAECLRCHPTGETLTRSQHTPFFPILTGPHGTTSCAECHTVSGDFHAYACIECHDHRQEITDPAHAGVAGYSFVSAECLRCHPTGESLSREEHDPFFPILTGRHGGIACAECHTVTGTFRAYECIECHTHECSQSNSQHREVSGYSCVSTECYRCHPRGTEDDF